MSAAVATVLMASTMGVIAAGPAQAAPSCTVRITSRPWTVDVNDRPNHYWDENHHWVWNGMPTAGVGFLDTFDVTNTGDPINPWTAAWSTPPDTRLVGAEIYNAQFAGSTDTRSASSWRVTAYPWNPNLGTGETVSFGMQGVVPDPTLTDVAITGFSLGGQRCTVIS